MTTVCIAYYHCQGQAGSSNPTHLRTLQCVGVTNSAISAGHSSQLDTHQESTADGDMDRDALGLAELSFVAACTTSQSPEHLFQAEVGIQCSEIAHAENSCPASRSNADTNANRSATAVTPAGLVVAVGLDRPSS